MDFLPFDIKPFLPQIISTTVTILIFACIRFVVINFIKRITQLKDNLNNRSALIIKYINFFLGFILALILTGIWGLDTDQISSFAISTAAFIGIALFAQWSVLSNITGGIVLFFSYPFKIGDVIKVQDKDFPVLARIEDITAFYIILTTNEGQTLTYPNNMMLQKGIEIIKDIETIDSIPPRK
ncbi:mechanosensitive ion channel family protein [Flavobacterium agricola]|uniref:Mechanosensitive ion channel family protein n=1 Tax=Flavobacterium agricola TaxID=2870839 RepID=A0ABY6M0X0_9FLAO|nr:mechanosensitive ion channel family protein [Flavobacterium agricola]UYW02193.1 mechanosensitive ion channel family protein [Flavobacterium agricola]